MQFVLEPLYKLVTLTISEPEADVRAHPTPHPRHPTPLPRHATPRRHAAAPPHCVAAPRRGTATPSCIRSALQRPLASRTPTLTLTLTLTLSPYP